MANIQADKNNLPVPQNLPNIPDDTARVTKLPTEEPWEMIGYSKEVKVSILKRGKVLKISSQQPQRQQTQKKLNNSKNGLPQTSQKKQIQK